jgi:hypothetical protein
MTATTIASAAALIFRHKHAAVRQHQRHLHAHPRLFAGGLLFVQRRPLLSRRPDAQLARLRVIQRHAPLAIHSDNIEGTMAPEGEGHMKALLRQVRG